jgi:PKHD-type hydroxylase
MFLQIPDVFNTQELALIDAAIADGKFIDSAPGTADKNNQQMERPAQGDDVDKAVVHALVRHDVIRSACLPTRVMRPIINRYETGMAYGWHTDNPLMADGRPVRTDIAVTIFLSDLDSYEGGGLMVNAAGGQALFRLPRGHAVLYPASAVHCVEPVTKGTRHAIVTWIQSVVADSARWELLYDLDRASRIIREKAPDSDEARLLMKSHANLMRMWAKL